MSLKRCPKCGKAFDPAKSPAFPFCSERCQMIDLGHWISEDYGLPEDIEGAFEDLANQPYDQDDEQGDNRNGHPG